MGGCSAASRPTIPPEMASQSERWSGEVAALAGGHFDGSERREGGSAPSDVAGYFLRTGRQGWTRTAPHFRKNAILNVMYSKWRD